MPRRIKIETMLPANVREEFDQRVLAGGFGNYRDLTQWLNQQGYEIRKSGAANPGEKLERRTAAIKQATDSAKAIVAGAPDDEGVMNDALLKLVQKSYFNIMVELQEVQESGRHKLSPLTLAAITRSVAALVNASVKQKQWMAELRDQLNAKVGRATEQVALAARAGGLSPEAAAQIRNALLDIHV